MADIIYEVNGKEFALRESSDGDVVVWRAYELPNHNPVEGVEFTLTTDVIADIRNVHQFDDPNEIAVEKVKQRLEEKFGSNS